jgi:hypothetical protein
MLVVCQSSSNIDYIYFLAKIFNLSYEDILDICSFNNRYIVILGLF